MFSALKFHVTCILNENRRTHDRYKITLNCLHGNAWRNAEVCETAGPVFVVRDAEPFLLDRSLIESLADESGLETPDPLMSSHAKHAMQGEDQKKLDVVSNDVFCNALRSSGRTGTIASEEEDVPVAVEETNSGDLPLQ